MSDIQVKLNFNDGTYDYDLPIVQSVSDSKAAMKAVVIPGIRGSGSVVIPGGQKSIEINVRGKLFAEGYKLLTDAMNTMRTSVTTDVATLTLKHNVGAGWLTDWARTVRRIEEIRFPASLRTNSQDYEISFLQISY